MPAWTLVAPKISIFANPSLEIIIVKQRRLSEFSLTRIRWLSKVVIWTSKTIGVLPSTWSNNRLSLNSKSCSKIFEDSIFYRSMEQAPLEYLWFCHWQIILPYWSFCSRFLGHGGRFNPFFEGIKYNSPNSIFSHFISPTLLIVWTRFFDYRITIF